MACKSGSWEGETMDRLTQVESDTGHPVARVSYRAIVAGALVASGAESVLLMLGSAVGLSTSAGNQPGFGAGMAIWMLLTMPATAYLGGFVAAAVARSVHRRDGALHGLVTWGLVTTLGFISLSGAIGRMGGIIVTTSAPLWGLFLGSLFGLVGALAGGAVGARAEAERAGLPPEPIMPPSRAPRVRTPTQPPIVTPS
jgi:hypothetical protein